MKNVLIHLGYPIRAFDKERSVLCRIQIDNSYRLGWGKEDILLVTNFKYEYNGVESMVVGDENYCPFRPRSTNTVTIPHLFELGIIKEGELYWVHDFDAFQNHRIDEVNRLMDGADVGLTTYGWSRKWCMGSFFFKSTSRDFFELIKEVVYKDETEDERALVSLTRGNINNINNRYKVLNITYNLGMRGVESNYNIADKPIKVLHFHPSQSLLQTFMYGKNGLGMPLMSEGLVEVFNQHGIK